VQGCPRRNKLMNNKLKSMVSAGFALLLGMTALTSPAIATTPDGTTPPNEGVCDVLMADGVTKGLYGLCVAYCEAQDLDMIDKEPPSTKILANYNKKKQASDPDMPCVHTGCPCWTDAQIDNITGDLMASCLRLPYSMTDPRLGSIQLADNIDNSSGADDSRYAFASVKRPSCSYVDTTPVDPDSDVINTQTLSPDTADFCMSELDAICTGLGQ
jgi:hypothetical protein